MANSKSKKIVQFIIGISALLMILIAASNNLIPSSQLGGVIEQNMAEKIDATPLFYTESEDMPRLEKDVEQIIKVDK